MFVDHHVIPIYCYMYRAYLIILILNKVLFHVYVGCVIP